MTDKVQLSDLQAMKRDGRKIVGVVAWDYQMARSSIVPASTWSRSVTPSASIFGASNPLEVTVDQMMVVCQACAAGQTRAGEL